MNIIITNGSWVVMIKMYLWRVWLTSLIFALKKIKLISFWTSINPFHVLSHHLIKFPTNFFYHLFIKTNPNVVGSHLKQSYSQCLTNHEIKKLKKIKCTQLDKISNSNNNNNTHTKIKYEMKENILDKCLLSNTDFFFKSKSFEYEQQQLLK